jgi:hypothetical protein
MQRASCRDEFVADVAQRGKEKIKDGMEELL